MSATMACKICAAGAAPLAQTLVLGKHEVQYFRCPACGFVQTEAPYWLAEAYADTITQSDLGLVRRNLATARVTRAVISTFFDTPGPFLDYGGGYGLFVRLMRDTGYDFYREEPHTENLFARGWDAAEYPARRYALVTAFEVFEHLVEPLAEIERMLAWGRNLLFTTTLLPEPVPAPGAWWYYGLEHGQHVSLYSRRALERLASHFGLHLLSNGATLHLLTERPLSPRRFALVTRPPVAALLGLLRRRRSLLPGDYLARTGQPLG